MRMHPGGLPRRARVCGAGYDSNVQSSLDL